MTTTTSSSSSSSTTSTTTAASASREKQLRAEIASLHSSIDVISNKIKQFEEKCNFDDIETERQIKEMKIELEQIYHNKRIKTNEAYDAELMIAEKARNAANNSLIDMVILKEENRLKEEAIKLEEELIESMKEELLDREREFQAEFKAKMTKLLDEEEKEQAVRLDRALHTHKTELSILKEMV